MRYIKRTSWYLFPALVVAVFVASCNDNPTTIGSGYLPENVEFRSYTLKPEDFEIVSGISSATNTTAQGGIGIAVGTADDVTAYGMVAITSESQKVSGPDAKPVTAAALTFRTSTYRYGDLSTRQVSFDVVVLDEVFSANTQWNDALAATIQAAPSIGTFDGAFTDSTTISVPLDATAAGVFLKEYFRYETVTVNGQEQKEFRTLKSLALRPRAGNKLVATFLGVQGVPDSLRPRLRVTVGDTTVVLPIGVTNWIAKAENASPGAGKLMVMAGIPIRSRIRLNLDSIPSEATIHQAELRLFVDTAKSRHGTLGATSYLVAYLATDTSFLPGSHLQSNIPGVLPVDRLAENATSFTNIFRFTTLTPTIAQWLQFNRGRGTLQNKGLILAYNRGNSGANLETSTVDRTIFHGTDAADPALRPALTIIYSVKVDASK